MNNIALNIETITNSLGDGTRLVAISKTQPVEAILQAYHAGQRLFGENKVQEIVPKYESLPKDIEWHMVGHLQSNKVKYIAPFINTIHSVDSFKLLKEINKEALKHNRIIKCLLQIYIAKEETKFGLSETELYQLLQNPELNSLNNIVINGLMGMATYTENKSQIHTEFKTLKTLFDELKLSLMKNNVDFTELSMGMSDDYLIAVAEGSTFVRVGSAIFGERIY